MPELQLEAFADAAGAILAQQRREWSLEHAAFVAEHRAMLAELRRENAELLAALKVFADEQIGRVSSAIAAMPEAQVGPQGTPGERGEPGPPGERGIGIAAIERTGARLSFELEDGRVFDAGDVPRGEKGEPGQEGAVGRDGRDGLPGLPGAPGERAIDGKDGRDGIDGKDGLGFDDMTVEYDGERSFTFRLARGDTVKEWTRTVPVQLYRGVHVDGQAYEQGDVVTWGGSLYHCNEPTTEKPGAASKAWTLAVKRGQDGRDGKPGEKGEAGPEGKAGRDLTQKGPDGSKWG
jgi:integrin beta 3